MTPRAMQLINEALKPLIVKSGGRAEQFKLYVCPFSRIAEFATVRTNYGDMPIKKSNYVPKGYSYILEDSNGTKRPRGFAWVTRGEVKQSACSNEKAM